MFIAMTRFQVIAGQRAPFVPVQPPRGAFRYEAQAESSPAACEWAGEDGPHTLAPRIEGFASARTDTPS